MTAERKARKPPKRATKAAARQKAAQRPDSPVRPPLADTAARSASRQRERERALEPAPAQPRDLYGFTPSAPTPQIAFGLRPGRPVGDSVNDWTFGGDSLLRSAGRGGTNRSLSEILHVMSDADPQLSLALWQWMRLVNNGHQVAAVIDAPIVQPDGSVTVIEEVDPDGQVVVDELAKRVGTEYGGGMDQLVGVFVRTLLKEGAVAGEIEVSQDLKDIIDFHPVSPRRLIYRRVKGDDSVVRRVLGLNGPTGAFIQVSPDQVRYFPLDPEIENPYGHSPFTAAIQAIYFKAQMLRDLRKVMHVAGNPRIDVSVLYQTALKNVPAIFLQPGQESRLQSWINEQIEQVRRDYEQLEPDDGFVHWDHVKVGYVGPSGGGSVNVTSIELVLNRQISAGVKMLPLLLGMNETSTETHGSIQWQVQVAGIESVQKIVRRLFEWFYSTALEFYGSVAGAKMQFDQHRTVDAMVEATTKQIMANFHLLSMSQNWETTDEAAEDLFGHGAVGPDPLVTDLQSQVDQLTQLITDIQTQPAPAGALPAATIDADKPALPTLSPEMQAQLRTLVRDYSRTGDRKRLLADLVRLYTKPLEKRDTDGNVDPEALAEAMGKYEKGAKTAFYDLFPDVRDALKETGHIKEGVEVKADAEEAQ